MKKSKVVILGGKRGLIGKALSYVFSKDPGYELILHDKSEFDVLDFAKLSEYLIDIKPDIVLNAVSYNLPLSAEENPEMANRVNFELPKKIVEILKHWDSYLVHFSTYMVFDGKRNVPYAEKDKPNPKSVYGLSKLKGEEALINGNLTKWFIIRTSWPFGPWAANYVDDIIKTVLKQDRICACHKNIVSPTYTLDLADYTCKLLKKKAKGIYHVVNSGQASLCEVAQEIINLLGRQCVVEPVVEEDRSIQGKFPEYGVLDISRLTGFLGEKPRSWILALREYIFSYYKKQLKLEY